MANHLHAMKQAVSDRNIEEKALKRDKFCCVSCGLSAQDDLLYVVWSGDDLPAKDRVLKNALTVCRVCRVEPVRHRLPPYGLGAKLTLEEIAAQKQQADLYNRMKKREQAEEKREAKRLLNGLYAEHKWQDDQVYGVQRFVKQLGVDTVNKAIAISSSKNADGTPDERFRCFCGICWNWIKGT